MKKNLALTILLSIFFILSSSYVYAGEVDILVKKLVEKRILTKAEAEVLIEEMKEEGEKEKEEIKKAAADAAEVPGWVEKIKLKGDVRVRYQGQDTDNDGKDSRGRARVRARVGIIGKPADNWETGIGMATGGDDPRSTNETLDNIFESSDIRLDYAYAKYSPNKVLTLMAGKIKNPIWGTKDLLWDGDINPDGFAATINAKVNDNVEFFFTPAFFFIEEFKTDLFDNPSMIALQPGVKFKLGKNVSLKAALSYYDFRNFTGVDYTAVGSGAGAGTNARDAGGDYLYEYDALAFDYQVDFKLPSDVVQALSIFGQYVQSDADDSLDMNGYDDDTGYLFGVKFGKKSVKTLGDWQIKINYRELEADAWADFLPDSDFYDGDTGVKGMEYELKLGLTKNITLGLDYYNSKPIRGAIDMKQSLFQLDLVLKF